MIIIDRRAISETLSAICRNRCRRVRAMFMLPDVRSGNGPDVTESGKVHRHSHDVIVARECHHRPR
jgi:hypothetical protein